MAISRWPPRPARTTVTNLLRSGPLSVRGHLVALAQIECGHRAFGLPLARDPARGERPGAMPGADRAAPTIKRSFRAPGPWTTMIWRVLLIILLTCLLTPGGQARPGPGRVQFRPRLARTTREHQAPLVHSSLHHSELSTLSSELKSQVGSPSRSCDS